MHELEVSRPDQTRQPVAARKTIPIALVEEGQRMMSICNACRYCEGYCAVFPALERRLSFAESDLNYLANLCHNCGACYTACQYSPPHEFNLNLPRLLAEIRVETYEKYSWPSRFGALFRRNGLYVALGSTVAIALALLLAIMLVAPGQLLRAHPVAEGSFYALVPHNVMASIFGGAGVLILVAMLAGFASFWDDMQESFADLGRPFALREAFSSAAQLRYLDGGGEGCPAPGDQPSFARRNFHHLTAYGFLLCFAATSVATIYHYVFGWEAPYDLLSLPVILGTLGGIGLLIGPAGLLFLKRRRNPAMTDPKQTGMDYAFLVLLFAAGVSGLLLLALRENAIIGPLLALHLGIVMGLFISLPYGKFVHGIYRFGALVRYALERRRPGLALPSE
jgi:citrate/tricarballylate utilization protein